MPGPSSAAYPTAFREFNASPFPFLNLRPPAAYGPPITLFHPVFDRFLCALGDETRAIKYPSFRDLRGFTLAAAAFYSKEEKRRAEMAPYMKRPIGGINITSENTTNNARLDNVTFEAVSGDLRALIVWK